MGRPLNKKYFGNRNIGSTSTTADDKIGGESVASIAVTGTFSGKTTATPYAVTISAPDLPNGVQATATITFATGSTGSVTITEGGSGYITAPTATCALGGGTGTVTLTATLSVDTGAVGSATNQENAILMTAYLTGGSAVKVDIIKQTNDRRYKVTDGTRTGIVKLKASVATAAGEGSVRLVDTDGNTYFATKITAHKATITRGTGTQAAFPTSAQVKWNMTAATADSLLIDNA
jgi:hypothetical protein